VVVVLESGAGVAPGAVVVVVSFFVSVDFWSQAVTVSGMAKRAAAVSAVEKLIFIVPSSVSAEHPLSPINGMAPPDVPSPQLSFRDERQNAAREATMLRVI
jgi:hypothetical protein